MVKERIDDWLSHALLWEAGALVPVAAVLAVLIGLAAYFLYGFIAVVLSALTVFLATLFVSTCALWSQVREIYSVTGETRRKIDEQAALLNNLVKMEGKNAASVKQHHDALVRITEELNRLRLAEKRGNPPYGGPTRPDHPQARQAQYRTPTTRTVQRYASRPVNRQFQDEDWKDSPDHRSVFEMRCTEGSAQAELRIAENRDAMLWAINKYSDVLSEVCTADGAPPADAQYIRMVHPGVLQKTGSAWSVVRPVIISFE